MLTSVLENADQREKIKIFTIDGNISKVNKLKLQRAVGRFDKQIIFLKVDKKKFDPFVMNPKFMHITKETYYRIDIPNLLNKNISKVLYLDCDLIVRKNIMRLWKINIDDYYLAAVKTGLVRKRRDALGISEYFNAGVLLIHLQKWRKKEVSKQLSKFIISNPEKLKLMDQDALNLVLKDKWLKLDPKWNYTTSLRKKIILKNPAIVHFTGSEKPWNSNVPFREEYLKYLISSLWDQDL